MSFKLPVNGVCRGSEPLASGAAAARVASGCGVDRLAGAVAADSRADALPAGVPLLFIDASAPRVQTGLWQDGRWLAHRCSDAPALEEIFRSVSELLTVAGLPFSAIGGFIHNEGPGSILGIRLGAMALRIWGEGAHTAAQTAGKNPADAGVASAHAASLPEPSAQASFAQGEAVRDGAVGTALLLPVWAVRSLPLVAARIALRASEAGTKAQQPAVGIGVFSEFRQGLWNWFTPSAGDVFGDSIEVIETDELAQRIEALQPDGICRHLRHRKSWESPPVAVAEADADLRDCPAIFYLPGLLRRVSAPDALLTRAPEFKLASGERHRGADAGAAQASAVAEASDSARAGTDSQVSATGGGQV